MIRQYNNKLVVIESDGTTLNLADIYCNSDDTKPTENLANGSKLTEVDTGKTYLFDEDNEEWVEYSAGGGGGGTGGNSAILTVNADKYGLICSNPNADIINLEQIYETNITVYYSIYSGGKAVYRNQDVNETLSLSDLYYLDNGSEVPYSGIKNFATLEDLVTITGSSLAALDSALLMPSSVEYYLILDLDTGHVIYSHDGN